MERERITHYKLFIAAPSDAIDAKTYLKKAVITWNSSIGSRQNRYIQPIIFEENVSGGFGSTTARCLESVETCNFMICVFMHKYYSEKSDDFSPTAVELEKFISGKKPYIVYFIQRPIIPSSVEKIRDLAQITNLRDRVSSDNRMFRDLPCSATTGAVEYNDGLVLEDISNLLDEHEKTKGDGSLYDNVVSADGVEEQIEKDSKKDNWFEVSITEHIKAGLSDLGLSSFFYSRELNFRENVDLWSAESSAVQNAEIANAVRQDAFDRKYGRFNYDDDLRSLYADKWCSHIVKTIKETFMSAEAIKLVGVAANIGIEIEQILKCSDIPLDKCHVDIVDFSRTALKLGKEKFGKSMNFIAGNMEQLHSLRSHWYDLYLNLRSIHSNGVDLESTIIRSKRVLKPGGLAIFSVSNGYIINKDGSKIIEKGMYNSRFRQISKYEPGIVQERISEYMIKCRFSDIEIHTGPTEIFIIGKNDGVGI